MSWFTQLLTSSLGKKLVMSLTGLFLILFLPVHLIGNLQLMADDGGESFNLYAKFMTGNPLIKTVSYLLYGFILLHAIQGMLIWKANRGAGGGSSRYQGGKSPTAWSSRQMAGLGMVILVFILLHMWQFWFQMKWGDIGTATYGGVETKDLYTIVQHTFKQWWFVLFYVISMIVIGFHLQHGFQSAFQTLGLNHKKYTPAIKTLGLIYSIIIPLAFAIIPCYILLIK
ncbi:MAG: succinate dehydrogenase cytochrome b subunit [Saprospiraceae bacterium]|nr:succinate dehydrogenase cytochrome b subunit [Saprospiraceae bacterium]